MLSLISSILLLLIFAKLLFATYKKFVQGFFSVSYPAVAALFFFYGLPVILDFSFGPADFSGYKGFSLALDSENAAVYYNLYLSYVCIIFYRYIIKTEDNYNILNFNLIYHTLYKYRYLLWIMMLTPIIMVFIANNPENYLNYQAVLKFRSEEFKESHALVFRFALLSVVSGAFLIYFIANKNDTSIVFKLVLYLFLLFLAFWVDGKRGIFFKYFFMLLTAGVLVGKIRPKKILRYVFSGLIVLTSIVFAYGKDFASNSNYSRSLYGALRLNIGRDHTVKYTLYKEFVEGGKILQYRGQSFLFDLLFFVPRSIWPEKPYPYAVYYVSSVLNFPPEPIGWSFTTSILEEMISNFGFIGIFLAPFFLIWICKVGDGSKNLFLKILSIVVVVFFQFTQLAAFMPLFVIFLIIYFKNTIVKKGIKT
ncbi:hypothetical protein ACFOUP_01080 [Belliella kenyensis]|uniref:Oligosaccharide repeat unit polymerase n=1 Tax=Belliella kenyensis TaxID=1472724 RepID=A0ABV8EG06_9BACT|nr:hypothetical protein [Belliella kenyensis]MCH7401710.1 hypothetical protein [Belliella kenyensis]MDN3604210.1 hypothetical protein [Belliella kenyensis]